MIKWNWKRKFSNFGEFMAQKEPVNRWFIVRVALIGACMGALFMILMTLLGVIR